MNRPLSILLTAVLLLMNICLFGQTQKKQEVTHSDSLCTLLGSYGGYLAYLILQA